MGTFPLAVFIKKEWKLHCLTIEERLKTCYIVTQQTILQYLKLTHYITIVSKMNGFQKADI